MKRDIFKKIILDNQDRKYSFVTERDYKVDDELNKVHCLIGVRRSGKTYLMYSLMNQFTQQYGKERVLFINMEDDRIFPVTLQDLNEILEAYYELYPDKRKETVYFFFDEIQQAPDWEKFIRRIYDSENCRIFISGSSAKLLNNEIASSLRGRNFTTEIFPLSFKEFLHFKKIDHSRQTSHTISKIIHALQEYLRKGGFPELVHISDAQSRSVLHEYADLIIYRDLIDRYGVSNIFLMKHLVKKCLSGSGELISYNKLHHDLRSQGLIFSRNTLYDYISYMEDAYALFAIPIFSRSVRAQNRNPRKLYAVDTGFKTIFSVSEDIGRLYETVVFLHLRRKYKEIFYYKGNHEVDFWVPEKQLLINVAHSIENTKTYYREIDGLMEAMNELKTDKAYLLNATLDEAAKKEDKTVLIIPLWRWLLEH